MSIYEKAIERVGNGASFSVDFKNRILRINRRKVDLEGDLGVPDNLTLDEWLDAVEDLYDNYKYSRPTQRSMMKERKCRFRALTVDELTAECGHNALNNPESRDVAQAKLEIFILLTLVNGVFKPEELFAKDWFFQGTDKQLIIRKDWF